MTSKSQAYVLIEELIIRFNEQIDSYKSGQYNETLTRRDFIDPFFKALGWDIDNSQGYAEAYREVIHEDKVKIGRATKAPDYSFRLGGGKRLFFVEAKKPSIDVKGDISVAYQIRRYGWSAKLPVSIITDFEEFAVYDCTKKPNPLDRAGVARIKYLRYDKYLEEFDYLWNTFSKEQVLKGSFDRYVQKDTVKKGTATVDKEFLISLDTWRTYLATSISIKNKQLDEDEINFAVQMTIDRLIFLRIAEDRGVEAYGQLKASVNLKGDAYQNLFFNFKRADEKYNSGIFDFKKDVISENLIIDSKVIKTIINEMYYPVSPYEFSVLSVEILGSAYEQFLGKQIKIDESHHAKIEDKPEVRKAGGVYYTPQYVVDYIVKNTVGKLIDGKTPKQIAGIKIVDPACGSGSFLIGAYQYLIDFHKNYYTDNGTKTGKKDSPVTVEGNLTSAEKKRILLNNIYGVDIDVNAVEVTKLSLLLKCLEGETETSLTQQYQLWHERILPTLDENIKSGNSLVDMDYHDGMIDFDPAVEKRVKPFSWLRAFPEVFKLKVPEVNPDFRRQFNKVKNIQSETVTLLNKYNVNEPSQDYKLRSGFDIVIGNPPYGAVFSAEESSYFRLRYNTSVWRVESYLLFIEQAMRLLKPDGFMGFIIPDTLLNLKFTQPARELLLRNSLIQEVVGLPSNVFEGATVDTIILLTEKVDYNSKFHPGSVLVKSFGKKQNISVVENPQKEFFINTIEWFEQDAFNLQADETEKGLLSKIEAGKQSIADIAEMYSGIKAYEVGKGKPAQTVQIRNEKPYTSKEKVDEKWFPFFDGKHIGRYQLLWIKNNWIKYGGWLAAPRNPENFEGEKILIRKITGKTLIATYIAETSYCNTLLFVLKLKEKSYSYKSVLAVLNSDLIGWYFRNKFQISDEDTFPQIMIRDILQFPLPLIDQLHDTELNGLVAQILQLNIEKSSAKLPSKIEQLESKIEYCENRINRIVYQLYELTEEEIKIVEGK
ncbi:MAG: N-6 DNA methylase [Lentimicrobiaceae bacterium]|jgi:type I restriction-modification system DNA methylase subunit